MSIDTEDQAALRASVRDLLSKHSDSAAVRAAITTEIGYDAALWSKLCEQIGVAALAIPEEFDGVGAGLGEVHVVQEELGRTLTPSPMLGSAILAAQALLLSGDNDACSRLLPGVASGGSRPACRHSRGKRRPGRSGSAPPRWASSPGFPSGPTHSRRAASSCSAGGGPKAAAPRPTS